MEEDLELSENSETGAAEITTLYKVAAEAMEDYIEIYLALSKQSDGFSNIQKLDLTSRNSRLVVIRGLSMVLDPDTSTSEEVKREAERMLAITLDTESAITAGVYERMRLFAGPLVDRLFEETDGFRSLSSGYISANPGLLPFFQQLAGLRSKSELKRAVGNASDKSISKAVAGKIVEHIIRNLRTHTFSKERLLQAVEPTLEGIVRDLVGKVLLENIVADALSEYAKDKMFSAINWKGRNQRLLGILVVEGPWTRETLRVMANVFDYVTPCRHHLVIGAQFLVPPS